MLISDFARLGQVTVRMLRHYDEIGLLHPDFVDPFSGYRSYSPEQLFTLNRLVALKDLGFGLEQVRTLMASTMSDDEFRDLLEQRRSALEEEEVQAASIRLAAVELRLRLIEQEKTMPTDYVVKHLAASRLVGLTRTVPHESIAQHVGPMFEQVSCALGERSGGIATYQLDGDDMTITVGYVTDAEVPDGLVAVDLPASRAVCGVHLGSMATIDESWQALMHWAGSNGHDFAGPCREVYLKAESPDQADWVTELQQPIAG